MTNANMQCNVKINRGQSTVELLVSLAVIAPLFMLIPVVANYLDIQTATHEASRYVAWERTAYTTLNEGAVADAVRERFIERESAGFSAAAVASNNERWKDYGSVGHSSLVDGGASVGVEITTLPLNINDPVANSGIGAIQAMNPNAFGATAVSFPLASQGSLLANFSAGTNYLNSTRNQVAAPFDPVAQTTRFHTKSSAVLLAANSVVPQNAAAYQNITDSFVSTDGDRLSVWQAPLRLLNVLTLGFFDELEILNAGGDLEAVADDQSTILPEGLIEFE
ncbi:MAG: hypothetical protein R3208_07070 [Ketobacteraceae bacterium]|nr:hypothetical protein [Ketobacteraceae bacterium]